MTNPSFSLLIEIIFMKRWPQLWRFCLLHKTGSEDSRCHRICSTIQRVGIVVQLLYYNTHPLIGTTIRNSDANWSVNQHWALQDGLLKRCSRKLITILWSEILQLIDTALGAQIQLLRSNKSVAQINCTENIIPMSALWVLTAKSIHYRNPEAKPNPKCFLKEKVKFSGEK